MIERADQLRAGLRKDDLVNVRIPLLGIDQQVDVLVPDFNGGFGFLATNQIMYGYHRITKVTRSGGVVYGEGGE